MKKYTHKMISDRMTKLGMLVFGDSSKDYDLNIVGIRNGEGKVDLFDDQMHVFWTYKGKTEHFSFIHLTTEPGLKYLKSKMINIDGTAILKANQQIKGMYQLIDHKKYGKCLAQVKPCTVIRDFDKDGELDYNSGKEQTGLFGIFIHAFKRALGESILKIGPWSAGCQVFGDINQYDMFIDIVTEALEHWNNSFTYTLLDEF